MDRELILAHDPLFFYAPQPGLDTGKGLVFRNGFTDGLVMGEEPVPAVHDLALQLWIEVSQDEIALPPDPIFQKRLAELFLFFFRLSHIGQA